MPLVADRQVIKTATVSLRVDVKTTGKGAAQDETARMQKVDEVTTSIRGLVGPGGYVSGSDGRGDTAVITLRVAPTGYDGVFAALGDLGTVLTSVEKTEDVTGQMVDVKSRLATMKASVDRTRLLLSKAEKVGDIIAIESELTSREADLESLEQQVATLSNQVGLSTITVTVQSRIVGIPPVAAPVAAPVKTGFAAGLEGGWKALKSFIKACLQVAGALLPFLPLMLIVTVVAIWWRRRYRKQNLPPVAPMPAAATGTGE